MHRLHPHSIKNSNNVKTMQHTNTQYKHNKHETPQVSLRTRGKKNPSQEHHGVSNLLRGPHTAQRDLRLELVGPLCRQVFRHVGRDEPCGGPEPGVGHRPKGGAATSGNSVKTKGGSGGGTRANSANSAWSGHCGYFVIGMVPHQITHRNNQYKVNIHV